MAAGLVVNHGFGLPLPVLLVAAAVAALGLFVMAGATPAALGLLADISERFPRDRGAIMGLYSVFLAIGQIAGALIGGFAAEAAGIDGMLVATAVLLLIALLPLARLRRSGGPGDGDDRMIDGRPVEPGAARPRFARRRRGAPPPRRRRPGCTSCVLAAAPSTRRSRRTRCLASSCPAAAASAATRSG